MFEAAATSLDPAAPLPTNVLSENSALVIFQDLSDICDV